MQKIKLYQEKILENNFLSDVSWKSSLYDILHFCIKFNFQPCVVNLVSLFNKNTTHGGKQGLIWVNIHYSCLSTFYIKFIHWNIPQALFYGISERKNAYTPNINEMHKNT